MIREDAPVSLQSVHRRFGGTEAVAGITFTVQPGEMFGMIGPDGAGKTTTLRILLGLLAPDEGRVRTLGLDPRQDRAALAHRVGYLAQRFSLYGDLSVDENIAFFAEVHGVSRWRPRRDELLDLLRLGEFRRRLAERLSGGMKQKLALACTLIHTPELLVLDEPTTGVDPVSRREFWRILTGLQRDGLTLLLTTPYLDEAERCQRVALMNHGRLLEVDAPDRIRSGLRPSMIEVLAHPRRVAQDWLRGQAGIQAVENFGERLHVMVNAGTNEEADRLARGLRAAGCQVVSVRAVPPSLEDAFIARIRSDRHSAAEVSAGEAGV